MFKITKSQIVKGQKVVICDPNKPSEKYSDLFIMEAREEKLNSILG